MLIDILNIAIILLNLLIAFFVLFNNTKNKVNVAFFVFVILTALWVTTLFFFYNITDSYYVLILGRLNFVTAIFFIFFLLYFIYLFLDKPFKINKYVPWLFLFETIILSFITLATDLVDRTEIVRGAERITIYGPLYLWFVIHFLFYLLLSLFILFKQFLKSKDKKKQQIFLLIIGIVFPVAVTAVTNIIVPLVLKDYSLQKYGTSAVLAAIFLVSYAILRFNLMNIRVVVTEVLAIFLSIASFLEIFNFFNQSTFARAVIFAVTFIITIILIQLIIKEANRQQEMERLNKELQKVTTDLKAANKELQRLDDAKSEFLSIASHQLRTPVTIIKGYASMIIEGSYGKVSKKIVAVMKNVALANDRLLNLIENLLDISRIEAGRLEFDLKEVDLAEVVRPIVADFQQKAKAKKLKLQFFENEKVPKVVADTKKISEVISNVIDNSVKYTPAGEIIVSLHEEGTSVVFSCQDTGLGILSEDLPRLFHKFVRGKDMMKVHTEGTGLGMYFARTVVENMGGRIWAESPGKNRGSKFCFSLPLADKKKAKKIKTV